MKYCRLSRLSAFAALVGLCLTGLQAAELENVSLVLHEPSDTSASIQALENDRMVALKSAHFGLGNADLKLDEIAALDNFVRRFCSASESIIELRGYAEGAGSAAQDLALSTERAKAVARFLTERGVPQKRILIVGLGEVDPESHRVNPEHQRVDIRIFDPWGNDSVADDAAAASGSSGEK